MRGNKGDKVGEGREEGEGREKRKRAVRGGRGR